MNGTITKITDEIQRRAEESNKLKEAAQAKGNMATASEYASEAIALYSLGLWIMTRAPSLEAKP